MFGSKVCAALRSRPALFAAAVTMLALAGCESADRRTVPGGVIVPDRPPGALVGGIYSSVIPHDSLCCWATNHTAFRILKDEPATDLALKIYIPDTPTFRQHRQSFDALLDGKYRVKRCCFAPGLHTVLFPLPPELRERRGPLDVQVAGGQTIVPAKEGLGPDNRVVAYVFVSARFTSL